MSRLIEVIRAYFGGWPLSAVQEAQLDAHYALMLRWNARLNLTRITDVEEAARRHYAESLFLAWSLPAGSFRIVDVGSGPGFPGFPIGVARPECQVTLVESVAKKAAFLKEAARGIPNVAVRPVRGEAVERGSFDWVVSRAVDPREVLALRLADRWALLLSLGDAEELGARCIPLPWDETKVVAMFHVEQTSG